MKKEKNTKQKKTGKIQKVPFLNLRAQNQALEKDLLITIQQVIRNSRFILGPETKALEQEVALFCQAKHAIGVNSGTDALMLALKALNIGPGDEVIVPDYTFIATATPVLMLGATPVLVDIEPETFTLDPELVLRAITSKTKAIIPVHLYGQPADMSRILKIARSKKIAVIEDAAQSLGSAWQGRPVGALGDMGCISFFPTKNLGALGDAGMVVTNSARLAKRLRSLRDHGAEVKYCHTELGYNTRLDEIQAAALRVKLPLLKHWNDRRKSIAAAYARGLPGSALELPLVRKHAEHVYHQYVVRSKKRDALQAYATRHGIGTAVHYPRPLHQQPVLAKLPSARKKFPHSEKAAKEILCLPIAPECTDQEIKRVIEVIKSF
ncbi:DegT/DnrJ/EryC1/StrS family aminotransferase [bacterium]|nr:DegT/DnrJ/EryC1/StrS family aminotransferase [bacterium]